MSNADIMTPEEKTEGASHMEKHVKYEDALKGDLQELDEGNPIGMPSIYKEGELTFIDEWWNELISIKDRALSRLD